MIADGGITGEKASVLFVCVKNGGKSQMAAGIMRHAVGEQVDVDSAGTRRIRDDIAARVDILTAQLLPAR